MILDNQLTRGGGQGGGRNFVRDDYSKGLIILNPFRKNGRIGGGVMGGSSPRVIIIIGV